jgi:SP family sugar:H+ symporter-like MFS transporter
MWKRLLLSAPTHPAHSVPPAAFSLAITSLYVNGVLRMDYFRRTFGHPTTSDKSGYSIHAWGKSLITSILSAGTLAVLLGRRFSIMLSCLIISIGVALQTASTTVGLLIGGHVVTGLCVGSVSAIVILYISEIYPRRIRGTLISDDQFAIALFLLIASCADQATYGRKNYSSYRTPIAIQFVWAAVLAGGHFFLLESPRWYVEKGHHGEAIQAPTRVRDQPPESEFIQNEITEIVANYEYELAIASDSWLGPLRGESILLSIVFYY